MYLRKLYRFFVSSEGKKQFLMYPMWCPAECFVDYVVDVDGGFTGFY